MEVINCFNLLNYLLINFFSSTGPSLGFENLVTEENQEGTGDTTPIFAPPTAESSPLSIIEFGPTVCTDGGW